MTTQVPKNTPQSGGQARRTGTSSSQAIEARAAAQRVKLEAQGEAREEIREEAGGQEVAATVTSAALKQARKKKEQGQLQAARRANTTIVRAIDDCLLDHEGGNHSAKTLDTLRPISTDHAMKQYFSDLIS
jgi:hypothetical protein